MVLVQHQDEATRDIAFHILSTAGYECRGAASPAEAWDILCFSTGFELLLCNAAVSLEEGLIERVVERFPDIPVIAWGLRPFSVFLETIRKGAYDYLPLPFEREQLIFAVRRALEYRRLKLK